MNVLDENIVDSQRQLLRSWHIPVRQIGQEVGRAGMKDDEILPLLHGLRRPVFFTRDQGFYNRDNVHPRYGIIVLDIGQYEVASFVRRFLKNAEFETEALRMGIVVKLTHQSLRIWKSNTPRELEIGWK